MDNMDIENIWEAGHQSGRNIETVEATAKKYNKKSLQLVERIYRTGRKEHRIFLIVVGVAMPVLLLTKAFIIASSLLIFTGLIIWKYEVEMGILRKIKFQDNTLNYLISVKRLLNRFMLNYKIGIMVGVPLLMLGGMIIAQNILGKAITPMLMDPVFWFIFLFACFLSIGLSRLWLHFWVHTLYGKKFKELQSMIEDLETA
ncbi:hypothetical protein QQ008_03150 [Fulvivirgaceae bacterium BMA10]|uniref:Uncharacterized protein n=1 Tax=Splendidivirga corallicola TaxID=3051826 RepID=A0ABT8KJ91_9BACT|nr:hypothetical protein [Fulvivirgaceae bacterium BMA10]